LAHVTDECYFLFMLGILGVVFIFKVAKQRYVIALSVESCKSDEPIVFENIKLTTTLATLPFVVSCLMKSI